MAPYSILQTGEPTGWFNQAGISSLFSIFFIDSNTGWAAGASNLVKTVNGGNNWVNIGSPIGNMLSVFFINVNTGWVSGSGISKSSDGGLSWITQPQIGNTLYSIFFNDNNNGWVVGGNFIPSYICKTTNSGANWNVQTIQSIYFLAL